MTCLTIEGFQLFLRLAAEGSLSPAFLVCTALFAAMVTGVVLQRSRIRATQRLLAAAEAYAELEISRDPQIPAREFMASFAKVWARG
jgi:hypothetical protein